MGGLGGLRSSEWGNWYGRMKGRVVLHTRTGVVVDVRMRRDMNIKTQRKELGQGQVFRKAFEAAHMWVLLGLF